MDHWADIEGQIRIRDAEAPAAMRATMPRLLRAAGLTPFRAPTKKMAYFRAPAGALVAWAIDPPATSLFFEEGARSALEAAGLTVERLVREADGSGRHSNLNPADVFGDQPCLRIRVSSAEEARAALAAVVHRGTMALDPAALDCWIELLQRRFPGFRSFRKGAEGFDAEERNFKIATREALLAQLDTAGGAEDRATAAVEAFKRSNLVNWRVFHPLTPTGNPGLGPLAGPVSDLIEAAMGPAEHHPQAVNTFVEEWIARVPEAQRDAARQICGFLLMHLAPEAAVFWRRGVLDPLYREATGTRFPRSPDAAAEYAEELRFAEAIRAAFEERGLAPRDLIDVQGATWVVARPEGEPAEDEGHKADTLATDARSTVPLNTILYGPPGTGKTFATMRRSVEICDGSAPDDMEEVRARYGELCREKRVEFVTFHQSYGYEEFVEALHPETRSEDDEDAPTAGFRLVPVDGVLKRIAERARRRPALAGGVFDPSRRKVFKVSLGRSTDPDADYIREECFANGYVLLGYGGGLDWSDPKFDSWEEIAAHWRSQPGKETASGSDPNIVQTWQFRAGMAEGDIVIASRGLYRVQAIGVVSGPYEFEERDADSYVQKRPVRWLWKSEDGEGIDVADIYRGRFSQASIYQMARDRIIWDSLLPYLQPQSETLPPPPHVLIIDEINRANISKVMGELITLLEEDKREGAENAISVVLPHTKRPFALPKNLHILGTMNTADRSIALLDTALRRRFAFEELPPRPDLLRKIEDAEGVIDLPAALSAINARLEYLLGPDHLIGHAWMMTAADRAGIDHVMARKIIPLLKEYFHEDLARVRAVLGGGDGFLRREPLAPPPGLADAFHEPRFRYVDRYAEDRAYPAAAWPEIVAGIDVSTAPDGGIAEASE